MLGEDGEASSCARVHLDDATNAASASLCMRRILTSGMLKKGQATNDDAKRAKTKQAKAG